MYDMKGTAKEHERLIVARQTQINCCLYLKQSKQSTDPPVEQFDDDNHWIFVQKQVIQHTRIELEKRVHLQETSLVIKRI